MAGARVLREGETVIVTLTPIAEGVVWPLLAAAVPAGAVTAAVETWHWAHAHSGWLWLTVIPGGLWLVVRLARWRAQQYAITTERVIEQRGVVHRTTSSVEWAAVTAVHYEQRATERLRRRGQVTLDLGENHYTMRRLRRPEVVARVIDHVRLGEPEPPISTSPVPPPPPMYALPATADAELAPLDDHHDHVRWRHLFGPSAGSAPRE